MNKTQLIDRIARSAGVTKVEAHKMMDAFTEVLTEELAAGEKVSLLGFGTFTASMKPARVGRNPRTGAMIKVPPKMAVKFRAGSDLITRIQG